MLLLLFLRQQALLLQQLLLPSLQSLNSFLSLVVSTIVLTKFPSKETVNTSMQKQGLSPPPPHIDSFSIHPSRTLRPQTRWRCLFPRPEGTVIGLRFASGSVNSYALNRYGCLRARLNYTVLCCVREAKGVYSLAVFSFPCVLLNGCQRHLYLELPPSSIRCGVARLIRG